MCRERVFSGLKAQSGFGLPAAVFVITVLALVIAAMAAIQQSSSRTVSLQVQSHRAFYSAESGIQLALNLLLPPDGSSGRNCTTSPFYSLTFTASGLSGCSVSVLCHSVTDSGETFYILNSTGSCGSGEDRAERQLEVMVQ